MAKFSPIKYTEVENCNRNLPILSHKRVLSNKLTTSTKGRDFHQLEIAFIIFYDIFIKVVSDVYKKIRFLCLFVVVKTTHHFQTVKRNL